MDAFSDEFDLQSSTTIDCDCGDGVDDCEETRTSTTIDRDYADEGDDYELTWELYKFRGQMKRRQLKRMDDRSIKKGPHNQVKSSANRRKEFCSLRRKSENCQRAHLRHDALPRNSSHLHCGGRRKVGECAKEELPNWLNDLRSERKDVSMVLDNCGCRNSTSMTLDRDHGDEVDDCNATRRTAIVWQMTRKQLKRLDDRSNKKGPHNHAKSSVSRRKEFGSLVRKSGNCQRAYLRHDALPRNSSHLHRGGRRKVGEGAKEELPNCLNDLSSERKDVSKSARSHYEHERDYRGCRNSTSMTLDRNCGDGVDDCEETRQQHKFRGQTTRKQLKRRKRQGKSKGPTLLEINEEFCFSEPKAVPAPQAEEEDEEVETFDKAAVSSTTAASDDEEVETSIEEEEEEGLDDTTVSEVVDDWQTTHIDLHNSGPPPSYPFSPPLQKDLQDDWSDVVPGVSTTKKPSAEIQSMAMSGRCCADLVHLIQPEDEAQEEVGKMKPERREDEEQQQPMPEQSHASFAPTTSLGGNTSRGGNSYNCRAALQETLRCFGTPSQPGQMRDSWWSEAWYNIVHFGVV